MGCHVKHDDDDDRSALKHERGNKNIYYSSKRQYKIKVTILIHNLQFQFPDMTGFFGLERDFSQFRTNHEKFTS